jgi:hypothetical protein
MAKLNALMVAQPEPRDFTDRLSRIRPAFDTDRGMVVQPPVDPGYAMPNVDSGNVVQTPGIEVEGWLPAGLQGLPPRNALLLELLRRYGL